MRTIVGRFKEVRRAGSWIRSTCSPLQNPSFRSRFPRWLAQTTRLVKVYHASHAQSHPLQGLSRHAQSHQLPPWRWGPPTIRVPQAPPMTRTCRRSRVLQARGPRKRRLRARPLRSRSAPGPAYTRPAQAGQPCVPWPRPLRPRPQRANRRKVTRPSLQARREQSRADPRLASGTVAGRPAAKGDSLGRRERNSRGAVHSQRTVLAGRRKGRGATVTRRPALRDPRRARETTRRGGRRRPMAYRNLRN